MCGLLALVGAGFQAAGAISQANAARKQADLKSKVASLNADVADTTARTARVLSELPMMEARVNEARIRTELEKTLGGETAHFAAGNLDPSFGAPLIAEGVSAAQAEVDVGLVRSQGALGRAQALAGAASSDTEAASDKYAVAGAELDKKAAMIAGIFGAGTAFLSLAGQFGGGGGLRISTPSTAYAPIAINPLARAAPVYSSPAFGAMGARS